MGAEATLGREIARDIPAEELPFRIERLLRGYLAARQPGESFRAFANRHSISDLAALLSGAPECASDRGRLARNAAGTAAVQNPGGAIP